MSTEDINDLPDSVFGYIEPGGSKDAQGKTVPRSKRHFPLHDRAHVQNALARMDQSPHGPHAKNKIMAAAKRYGMGDRAEAAAGEYRRHLPGMATRAFDFQADAAGDGRTLEGYAAVFGAEARISDTRGDFDETIVPGAFTRSLARRTPVMQWEHGKDPRVGLVPIAAVDRISEDSKGLHVRARLFDNPVVEPIRQAIAGGAVKGMSFRFQVPDGGDVWEQTRSRVDKRRVHNADVYEVGPVVWPAYDSATISVRSLLASFDGEERAALVRELAAELRFAADLTDLTGRPGAWSAGGGDPVLGREWPVADLPEHLIARHRALQMTGVIP
jgi:HK97 family phage prohead protease